MHTHEGFVTLPSCGMSYIREFTVIFSHQDRLNYCSLACQLCGIGSLDVNMVLLPFPTTYVECTHVMMTVDGVKTVQHRNNSCVTLETSSI